MCYYNRAKQQNKSSYIKLMKLITLFTVLLLVALGNGLRVLKDNEIPKEYPIGRIRHFSFGSDGRLFFQGQGNQMGFMDGTTGIITSLYILGDDEKVLDFKGQEETVIVKEKSIALFFPKKQEYIKLQYSDYLEKHEFSQILSFRRHFMYDYILTDAFLLKAQNPYAAYQDHFEQNKSEKFQILANKEEGQTFYSLIYLGNRDPEKVGIGAVSLNKDKTKLFLKKFYPDGFKGEKLSYDLDPSLQFLSVIEMGDNILVAYKQKRVILDLQMKHLQQSKEEQIITFIDELNILKPNAGKNLVADEEGKTLMFFDMGNPKGSNYVKVYEKYMLVKREDKVIVNIPIKANQKPERIWAHTFEPNSQWFSMIVEFENKNIKVYKINSNKNQYKDVWETIINDVKTIEGGTEIIPVEVTLKEEEKLIEEGQNGNIEEKQQQKAQSDIGEVPTEVQEPSKVEQQPPLLGDEGSGEPEQPQLENKASQQQKNPPLIGDQGSGQQAQKEQESKDLSEEPVAEQPQMTENSSQEQQPQPNPDDSINQPKAQETPADLQNPPKPDQNPESQPEGNN